MKTIIDFTKNGNIGLVMIDEKDISKTYLADFYATIAYTLSDEYAGWEYFGHFMKKFNVKWEYFSSANDEDIDKSITIKQADSWNIPMDWSGREFFSLMQDFEG